MTYNKKDFIIPLNVTRLLNLDINSQTLFVALLARRNISDNYSVFKNGQEIPLKKNQLNFTIEQMSRFTPLSMRQIRSSLMKLEKVGYITKHKNIISHRLGSIFTINSECEIKESISVKKEVTHETLPSKAPEDSKILKCHEGDKQNVIFKKTASLNTESTNNNIEKQHEFSQIFCQEDVTKNVKKEVTHETLPSKAPEDSKILKCHEGDKQNVTSKYINQLSSSSSSAHTREEKDIKLTSTSFSEKDWENYFKEVFDIFQFPKKAAPPFLENKEKFIFITEQLMQQGISIKQQVKDYLNYYALSNVKSKYKVWTFGKWLSDCEKFWGRDWKAELEEKKPVTTREENHKTAVNRCLKTEKLILGLIARIPKSESEKRIFQQIQLISFAKHQIILGVKDRFSQDFLCNRFHQAIKGQIAIKYPDVSQIVIHAQNQARNLCEIPSYRYMELNNQATI